MSYHDYMREKDQWQALARRCLEPLGERLDDLKNERALYEGYQQRQARYDRLIAENEELLTEVRAIVEDN